MPTLESPTLSIDLDSIEIEEIEVFLQEGSRGTPEFAASCNAICQWLCCVPSCNACCCDPQQPPSSNDEMDDVFSD